MFDGDKYYGRKEYRGGMRVVIFKEMKGKILLRK